MDGDRHIDGQHGGPREPMQARREAPSGQAGPAPAARRILMVNSVALFAQGLRAMLEATQAFEIVGECRDATATMTAIETLDPGLIVLDDTAPGIEASRLAARIMRQHPRIGVVMLTDRPASRFGRGVPRGAGHACVPRDAGIAELLYVLDRVAGRALGCGAATHAAGCGKPAPAVMRRRATARGLGGRARVVSPIHERRSSKTAGH